MSLRFRKFWLVLGIGFVMLVIYLSLTPDPPDTGVPEGMKFGHVMAYAWLMFWFAQLYAINSSRLLIAAAFCALGVGLEYLQGLTDYRGFEYSDMVINSAGVAIGYALAKTRLQHTLALVETVLVALLPFRNPR